MKTELNTKRDLMNKPHFRPDGDTNDLSSLRLPEFMTLWKYYGAINPILREKLYPEGLTKEQAREQGLLLKIINSKGSRGSGKTKEYVQDMIDLMVIDQRVSWIVIMPTISESIDKVFREFDEELRRREGIWKDFYLQWELKDNLQKPRIYKNNRDGSKQEIKFVSIKDMSKAGSSPLAGNYYAGYFLEEPTNDGERIMVDMQAKENLLVGLANLNMTISRYLKEKEVYGLIRFMAYNPYNGLDPMLKDHKEFLPDDLDKMKKTGWNETVTPDNRLLITTSVDCNTFANEELLEEIENAKGRFGKRFHEMLRWGVNFFPTDFSLSNVMPINEEAQELIEGIKPIVKGEFIPIGVGVDVSGGSAKTTAIMIGWHPTEHFMTGLEEYVYDPHESVNKKAPHEVAGEIIEKLKEWLPTYWKIRDYRDASGNFRIPIRVDGSAGDFESLLMISAHNLDLANTDFGNIDYKKFLSYEFDLFTQTEKTQWPTGFRARQWEQGIGKGVIKIFKSWTPTLYNELPMMKLKEGDKTKRIDGNDDCINAFEYGAEREFSALLYT